MICKCCGEDKRLIKAHIIPKAFYANQKVFREELIYTFTNTEGVRPAKSPIGHYDSGILCHDCEQIFQRSDHYAQQLLLKTQPNKEQIKENQFLLYFNSYDYNLLKRFLLSVLYRAHLSELPFFSKVNIGGFEAELRNILLSQDAISDYIFPCLISHYFGDCSVAIFDPHKRRYNGINWYRFFLGGYWFEIKVDSRKVTSPLDIAILRENSPLLMPSSFFDESQEYKVMQSIVSRKPLSR